MNKFDAIYNAVKKIPKGYVSTYGQIAAMAGNPQMARIVGYALHVNPDPDSIPCYRIVKKDGSLASGFAFGGPNKQRLMLEKDGIEFIDNHVDMSRFDYKIFFDDCKNK